MSPAMLLKDMDREDLYCLPIAIKLPCAAGGALRFERANSSMITAMRMVTMPIDPARMMKPSGLPLTPKTLSKNIDVSAVTTIKPPWTFCREEMLRVAMFSNVRPSPLSTFDIVLDAATREASPKEGGAYSGVRKRAEVGSSDVMHRSIGGGWVSIC